MISVQTVTAMSPPPPPLPSTETIRFEYLPARVEQDKAHAQAHQQQRLPAVRHHSPASPLSPAEFRTYNRMAELMELYHHNFRHTFRTFHQAVSTLDPTTLSGPTVRQIVALGVTFLHNLREHEATEDRRLFPLLATRMPAFFDADSLSAALPQAVASPFASSTAFSAAPPPPSSSWPPSLGQQHRHLQDHSLRIEKYLVECREGRRELQREELTAELNSFGGVLFNHLDEEVRELGADRMRQYWTLDEVRAMEL